MWYSPVDLAKLQCPSLPKTAKGIHERAKKEGWPSQKVRSRGGRDGTKFVYELPPDIQRQIDEIEAHNPMRDSRSDAALRFAVSGAPNPENAFEAMRRLRDASDLLQRLKKEVGYDPPELWGATLLELLVGEQITELGARRILEHLKSTLKGEL